MNNGVKAVQQISKVLEQVPWSAWGKIVERGPEFQEMRGVSQRYSPGAFLTLTVVLGLNDYQLKGKAETAYWPPLRKHLERAPIPDSPEVLGNVLETFYRSERLGKAKVDRLWRFLRSPLAKRLWGMNPTDAAKQIHVLWKGISETMGQEPKKKTIVFSAKTLGVGLLLLGEAGFDFRGIPVPVDSRLQRLTPWIETEKIQEFWDEVLAELRKTEKRLTHLHLDSLLWQYAGEGSDPRVYLQQLGISEPEQIIAGFGALMRTPGEVSSVRHKSQSLC
ncbi:MAG: N-glycosylase/DNA lyase [Elusimicrobia bacterium]|nr:N-glycosylase/DNA lyase [Elusimicrobiota bacterium]